MYHFPKNRLSNWRLLMTSSWYSGWNNFCSSMMRKADLHLETCGKAHSATGRILLPLWRGGVHCRLEGYLLFSSSSARRLHPLMIGEMWLHAYNNECQNFLSVSMGY